MVLNHFLPWAQSIHYSNLSVNQGMRLGTHHWFSSPPTMQSIHSYPSHHSTTAYTDFPTSCVFIRTLWGSNTRKISLRNYGARQWGEKWEELYCIKKSVLINCKVRTIIRLDPRPLLNRPWKLPLHPITRNILGFFMYLIHDRYSTSIHPWIQSKWQWNVNASMASLGLSGVRWHNKVKH